MKLLLIIPSFYPATVYGGPIFSTLHTCQCLSDFESIQVKVATTNANYNTRLNVNTNQWIVLKENFLVKYYNETVVGKFSLSFFLNIWKDIKHADVVHIQAIFSAPTPISLLFAKLFKKPTLLSPRGSFCNWGLNQGNLFKPFWVRLLIAPFNSFVYWHATCEQEKNDILKQFPNASVFIISNGIDYEAFTNINLLKPNFYIKKYTGKNIYPEKIIVSMGRLHKVKGFDILVEAFAKLLEIHKESILLIAGKDVGEKAKLEKLIQEKSLVNNVFFVGEVSGQDKIDFLANADLFVLPSHTENFGNVYIESLSVGTPIVASKNTPWQSVESAGCGKWVANTVEDTVRAMLQLLENDRNLMRINAKVFAKQYDWKNIAFQFKKLFSEIFYERV